MDRIDVVLFAGLSPCDNPSVREFVDSLVHSPHTGSQIVHRREIPPSPAVHREPELPVSLSLRAAAARLGVDRLYSHQAAALDGIRAGRDVAVVTPTASGKSLVYYLPTAERLADGEGHALYIFPNKALEQDQLEKLRVFGRGLLDDRDLTAEIYDGDTPGSKRRKIRAQPPDVLITNPEMLHLGLLAYHGEWARFFSSLRLVVIDELHVYRGVFGNHFAHVMRRLARIASHYGADPRYLVGSATVGNAAEFTCALLGRPFEVVSESGSPRARRHVLFVNPAGSPYTSATRIFTEAVRGGHRTIAFTKARKITELMHSWVEQGAPDLARRIAPYRAGYLPEERREIERRLFHGDLRGVIATSALELGIDVGGLDVCILVGYPGSVMSSWQRIGRVGRTERESLVVLVAQPDALDQYFMTHPDQFFDRGFERAVVDPSNPAVAGAHLQCAGAELPVGRSEAESYLDAGALQELLADGRLLQDERGERFFSLKRRPQRDVNLRTGGETYAIVLDDTNRSIGTIDGVRVFHECHEGAVYLHGGRSFQILRLDQELKRVFAAPFSGDYYTHAMGSKETEILQLRESDRGGYRLFLGRLKVTVRITEFARKRLRDQETISKHPLDVPPIVFETVGLWMTFPESLEHEAIRREVHFMGGLHAAEHTMISLFPLLALCDRGDVGGISYSRNPQLGAPAIFIYDGYPGGIGLAAAVHDRIEDLFRATQDLLETCPCEEGCPSCVQSPRCGSGNRPLDKISARLVLRHLTCGEQADPGEGSVRDGGEPQLISISRDRPAAGRQRGPVLENVIRIDRIDREAAGPGSRFDSGDGRAPVLPPIAPRIHEEDRDALLRVRLRAFATAVAELQGPRRPRSHPALWAWLSGRARALGDRLGLRPQVRLGVPSASGTGPSTIAPTVFGSRAFRLRPGDGRVLVFDVETRRSAEEVGGWSRIGDMGLALAVVYDASSDLCTTYFEKDVERLVCDLTKADLVVGYNSERFDMAVLAGYGPWDMTRIRSFDMMKDIRRRLGFRLKLADLAETNLRVGKSADGLQSLAWFREGRLDLIEQYCRQDVELTARLFFLGRERRYLLFRHHLGSCVRLPVDW